MLATLPHVEDTPKRIRVLFGGKYLIDTRKGRLAWLTRKYPAYHFIQEDLPKEFLHKNKHRSDEEGDVFDIVVGNKRAEGALTVYTGKVKELAGLFTITFGAMDAWFEEEEEVFVHCKDPYKRVDVLQSSRHVRVEIDGVELANTHMPRFLYETGLRVRTYIPKNECKLELFEASDLTTPCPYKGQAQYYDYVGLGGKRQNGVVWWYQNPLKEVAAIRAYMAFYDEKVDVWIDGVKQPRQVPPIGTSHVLM